MNSASTETAIDTYRDRSEFRQRLARLKRMGSRPPDTAREIKKRLREAIDSDDSAAIDAAVKAWLKDVH